MTSSTSTTTPMRHDFESRVAQVRAPKSDINALILDYLTTEGYPKAAAKFSKEANLPPQQEDASIMTRMQIRTYIHQGNILDAVEALNEYDPEILDKDAKLHFALLRLHLVELIRNCSHGDISPALQFATAHLAPRASKNPDFLEQLETTMALFIYPPSELRPEQAVLLHPDLRRDVADKVNKAILVRQTQRREAAIRQLVKSRAWAESYARAERTFVDLPDRIELGLHGQDADGVSHQNGHEPMLVND